MTRDVIDTVPTGKGWANFVPLIPGVVMSNASASLSQDVGGSTGFNFAMGAIHGGRAMDEQVVVNGMTVASLTGPGETRTNFADGAVQEYNLDLSAHRADIPYGGIFMNIVPKEGGNTFSGGFYSSFGTNALQANNLDSHLIGEGFTVANQTKKLVDVNPALGGALVQDRLWFYGQFRPAPTITLADSITTPRRRRGRTRFQSAGGKRSAQHNTSLNLTFRLSPKNKLTAYLHIRGSVPVHFSVSPTVSPERRHSFSHINLIQGMDLDDHQSVAVREGVQKAISIISEESPA